MDRYGLIGYPLAHSFSAQFFNEKFKQEKIDAEYLNFEIEQIDDLPEIIALNTHLRGLNVTIPYKETVLDFLDDISPIAKKIGAVNVIKVQQLTKGSPDYQLKGYNTDYIGFKHSLKPLIDINHHCKALVLGTGGASKAVCVALDALGVEWTYVSRRPKQGAFTYSMLTRKMMEEYKIIINTTPLGTYPDVEDAPTIPYEALSSRHLLYDLVYNPAETAFLKKGNQMGAITKNGAEMLRLQALAAWSIWTKSS